MRAPTNSKQAPTIEEEMALLSQGYSFIAGLDEAGRGSLAGPVVAAAVILPLLSSPQEASIPDPSDPESPGNLLSCFAGVRDSKQLTASERERFHEIIIQHALAVGVGIGSVEVIDERNILQATKYAMRVALAQLKIQPQALLLDAIHLSDLELKQRSIIKGDALCLSISAASIIAKVTRDRIMIQLHERYPVYGFAQNKGYGTEYHLAALREHGATPHHRRSFAPVRELFSLFHDEDLRSSHIGSESHSMEAWGYFG
jgi:ribonuclease HII